MAQKMVSPLPHLYHLVLVFISFQLHLSISIESDSINPGETLSGNRTLSSKGGVFEMGFFAPPGNSHNYYIGIWYKGLPMPQKTVVWVANRDHPITDPYSSRLELSEDGNLVLRTLSGLAVWSTNSIDTASLSNSTIGSLGNDGNFIVRERLIPFSAKKERKIWQSFDHPTDTWLPGAKFDEYTTILTSWKDTGNPAPGLFSAQLKSQSSDPYSSSYPQMLLKKGFTEPRFCFYDIDFNLPHLCGSFNYTNYYFEFVYSSHETTCLVRYVLDVTGRFQLFVWWYFMEEWHIVPKQQQTCDFDREESKTERESENKDDEKKNATWIAIDASAFLAPLFVGITVLLIIVRRKDSGSSFEASGETLKQFKHRDLQRATNNFTHKLGKGGFSTVYKGEFPGSTFIAVKELQSHLQEEKQLRAELNTVGLIQHKNLVRLRGFCLEHSKRFIVYDYMPNGSLESHLFNRGSKILDWGTRYNIALGTAKGLAYLHEECRDCIIHCDIKPENILLDAEYNPKVADFGLAKLLGRDFSRILTTIRGTRGYLAPEWFSGEPITAKVDLYSYGQVLFEIISGRRNMDMLNDDLNSYFPALILSALNNEADVLPLVDSKLHELNVEELIRVCKVACWCIQDHEEDRPTMTQVVHILEGRLDVGIPPIPRFFRSIAEASMKQNDINESEAYSTSSTMTTSFTFQPPVVADPGDGDGDGQIHLCVESRVSDVFRDCSSPAH